ncbi:unnamed protein product, partial [Didymodactylos carnosus]
CALYSLNQVTGSLCDSLCFSETFALQHCLQLTNSKIILLMKNVTSNNYSVIKSNRLHFDHHHTDLLFHDVIQSIPNALRTFHDILNFTLNKRFAMQLNSTDHHTIRRIYRHDNIKNKFLLLEDLHQVLDKYKDYYDRSLASDLTVELNTLYSLLDQHEFLLAYYYRTKKSMMPHIYGWCGHLYLQEYLTPLNSKQIEKQMHKTWYKRVWLAEKLLDLIDNIDNSLHQTLHFCDMKLANLGLTFDGQVKLLDLDMAHFDRHIPIEMMNCSTHEDCSYFDCSGYCDRKTQKCHSRRINNNLQVLCEKIFLAHKENFDHGLLDDIPFRMNDVLTKYLKQCSLPGRYKTTLIPNGAPISLMRLMQAMFEQETRNIS